MQQRRSLAPVALAAAATALALGSAWHSGRHVWRQLDARRSTYAPLTPTERRHAPLEAIGLPGPVFDFFATYLAPGDRVYYQVLPSGLGPDLDLPSAVAAAGRFYLLPAVQAKSLADATVVVSYFEDPSLLHLRFVTQVQAGEQPLYVSRIRAP